MALAIPPGEIPKVDGATKKLPMLGGEFGCWGHGKAKSGGSWWCHLLARWFSTTGNSLFLFRFSSLQT